MEEKLNEIQQALTNYYDLHLSSKQLQKVLRNIQDAQQYFPTSTQQALIIKLLNEWELRHDEKIITLTSEVCHVQGGPCVTTFGVLSPDWLGLTNSCSGVINEMGWNIYFIKAFSLKRRNKNLGIVLIAVRTDNEDAYKQLLSQTETILSKLHQAAVGTSAKAFLLSEEFRKLEIYSLVIAYIEKIYRGDDLEHIIGLNGEAVHYFAARSRDYIENRKIEDIAKQIIRNYTFIKKIHETGNTFQLDISNFTTKTEGTFTGVTVSGPAYMLNLEDCLKTIELTIPNFQLKHNREFTTNQGISVYRIEFVDTLGHPMSNLEQQRLRNAFSTMVLNKRRDRAQWIESIGGFEQYARAIIPLLVREAQHTGKTQVYPSVGHTTDLFIDFKVIIVVPPSAESRKRLVTNTVNNLETVPGLHIHSVKPPKNFGNTEVFIIDLRASLACIDNIETIYRTIKDKIHTALGDFRDFDEGMRTIDATKLKSVRQRLNGIDKALVRELYYSIEDFFRVSATVDEIITHIRIALEMIKTIDESNEALIVLTRQMGTPSKAGTLLLTASLLCLAFPHQYFPLQKILEILEPYEVTLSRMERTGRDILICRITKKEKALSEEELNKLIQRFKKLTKKKKKKIKS